MANLEAKTYMSSIQLSIVVFVVAVGSQIMTGPRALIASVGQGAWLSVIIGGVIFYMVVCLMLILGKQYPDETFVQYAPRLFGSLGGNIVILWFFLQFSLVLIANFNSVGKIITFYMFDRTPPEVIILALLVVCTYCAVQDWGTILRMQQIMFFVAYSMLMIVWMTSWLHFTPENMLPLWPSNIKAVISSSFSTWGMYSGYECVLMLLPLVYRQVSLGNLVKTMGVSFGGQCLVFVLVIVIIIGVLSVDTAKNMPYPALLVIRSIELPGTFIERLENYLLLAWIPIVFDTMVGVMFFIAQICMQHYRHADHRPWVLLLVPIIYVISILLIDDQEAYEAISKFSLGVGLGFSFVVVPLALMLSWWKKRGGGTSCGSKKTL